MSHRRLSLMATVITLITVMTLITPMAIRKDDFFLQSHPLLFMAHSMRQPCILTGILTDRPHMREERGIVVVF
ncbi:MAG: hypothetical protein ACJ788_14205 [Ktedonobacteraceae bacterium]